MEWARLTEGAHASCVRFAGIPARSTNTGEMPVNRSLELSFESEAGRQLDLPFTREGARKSKWRRDRRIR